MGVHMSELKCWIWGPLFGLFRSSVGRHSCCPAYRPRAAVGAPKGIKHYGFGQPVSCLVVTVLTPASKSESRIFPAFLEEFSILRSRGWERVGLSGPFVVCPIVVCSLGQPFNCICWKSPNCKLVERRDRIDLQAHLRRPL